MFFFFALLCFDAVLFLLCVFCFVVALCIIFFFKILWYSVALFFYRNNQEQEYINQSKNKSTLIKVLYSGYGSI